VRLARAFFSFAEIRDRSQHRAYNEWHQLDHRPENLALPGVIWGERWVKSPDCAALTEADQELFVAFHYLNSYLLREPVEQSLKDWLELGEVSIHWGRRSDLKLAKRPLMGFFLPVKGYANPRVLVPAEILPLRPNRGVHLTVTSVQDPNTAEAEEVFGWYDRVRIPDLLECRGAAGAWTFASRDVRVRTPSMHTAEGKDERLHLRFQLVYLDGDPLEFVEDLCSREPEWRRAGRVRDTSDVERVVYTGPLRAIIPWQWDWFDGEAST
jgi:hypothetical protein